MEYIILTADYYTLLHRQPRHHRQRYYPKSRLRRLYHHRLKNNKILHVIYKWFRFVLNRLLSLLPTTPPGKRRDSKPPVKLRTLRTRLHGRQLAQYASARRQYTHVRSRTKRVRRRTSRPCLRGRRVQVQGHDTIVHPRSILRHTSHSHTTMRHKAHIGHRPNLRAYTSTSYLPTGMSYTYDSDSKVILVDNCCSTSITNDLRDFIAPLQPARAKVEGYNGTTTATMVGTVKWKIHDDLGNEHQVLLPNTYYAPQGRYRLLCPQHWAQVANDNSPTHHGTWCATYADRIVLYWGQRRYSRTLRLIPSTNVGILTTRPGIRNYTKACHLMEQVRPSLVLATNVHAASNEEPNGEPNTDPIDEPTREPTEEPTQNDAPITVTFNNLLKEDEDITQPHPEFTRDKEELMYWHLRLGHLAFSRVHHMAQLGLLPRRILNTTPPFCSACAYGKMTRRPWRTKGKYNQTPRVTTQPGECVSVDQLESTTPGFIAQLKGIPTIKRYKAATVFVDNYSRLGYVYLQLDTTSSETLKAKQAFEAFAHSYGVRIQHYHADNGRFADNAFRASLEQQHQTISFCGVNAHWQNGIAERRIRDLQEAATTMLLYAQRRWPDAID